MNTNTFPLVWRRRGIRGGRVCAIGSGVDVEFIAERFAAGETIRELSVDYSLSLNVIEEAIRVVVMAASGARGFPVRIERRLNQLVPMDQGKAAS